MDVLVIGGSRFVGQLVTFRLLAGGHRVTHLNRGTLPDPFGARIERLRGDRRVDLARLTHGRRWDACIDLAAYTGDDARGAIAALDVGHYVFISTGQVYLVRTSAPRPAREEDYDGPVMPRPAADVGEWEYGVWKRDAEDALAAAPSFPSTRVRIPMVNGERDHYRRIERYLWRLLDGGPVLLPGGGAHRVRHVYGREVARFLVSILCRRETFGQAYNVAQQETPTLREVLEFLRAQLGSAAPLVDVPRAAVPDPVLVSPFSGTWMSFLDPTRVERELGFVHEPVWTGLSSVVANFLAHPPADFPPGYGPLERATERRLADASGTSG